MLYRFRFRLIVKPLYLFFFLQHLKIRPSDIFFFFKAYGSADFVHRSKNNWIKEEYCSIPIKFPPIADTPATTPNIIPASLTGNWNCTWRILGMKCPIPTNKNDSVQPARVMQIRGNDLITWRVALQTSESFESPTGGRPTWNIPKKHKMSRKVKWFVSDLIFIFKVFFCFFPSFDDWERGSNGQR